MFAGPLHFVRVHPQKEPLEQSNCLHHLSPPPLLARINQPHLDNHQACSYLRATSFQKIRKGGGKEGEGRGRTKKKHSARKKYRRNCDATTHLVDGK